MAWRNWEFGSESDWTKSRKRWSIHNCMWDNRSLGFNVQFFGHFFCLESIAKKSIRYICSCKEDCLYSCSCLRKTKTISSTRISHFHQSWNINFSSTFLNFGNKWKSLKKCFRKEDDFLTNEFKKIIALQ